MSYATETPIPFLAEASREKTCVCGGVFPQTRVSPDWLNSPAFTELRKHFKAFMDIEVADGKKTVWFPKFCGRCSRKARL